MIDTPTPPSNTIYLILNMLLSSPLEPSQTFTSYQTMYPASRSDEEFDDLSSRESIPTKRSLQVSHDDRILPVQHTNISPNRQPTHRCTPSTYQTHPFPMSMASSHATHRLQYNETVG